MIARNSFLNLLISVCCLLHINGEYRLYNTKVPSFLYRSFDDIKNDIFPENITIVMSLSHIGGTLLYSVDRLANQFIMSLSDAIPITLIVELNGRKLHLSIPKICQCDPCVYEILKLTIYASWSSIHIQCNDGVTNSIDYGNQKFFNKAYPVMNDQKKNDKRVAHLWLANTPPYKDVYPNSDQLSGCIFNVLYNNTEIIFTNITGNIGRSCTRRCNDKICNGGQCYETYNSLPVCNCTMTFLNGDYCNDTVSVINKQTTSQKFTFVLFKLSWKSTVMNIMRLENEETIIQVFVKENNLVLEYQMKDVSSVTSVLLKGYKVEEEYILIGHFRDTFLDIKLHHNGEWHYFVTNIGRDLSNKVFDKLTLRSGKGVIGMASKNSPTEFPWQSIKLKSGMQLNEETAKPDTNDVTPKTQVVTTDKVVPQSVFTINTYVVYSLVVLFLIVLGIGIVFGVIYLRNRGQGWRNIPFLDYDVNDNTALKLFRWMRSRPDFDPPRRSSRKRNSSDSSPNETDEERIKLTNKSGSKASRKYATESSNYLLSPLISCEDVSEIATPITSKKTGTASVSTLSL